MPIVSTLGAASSRGFGEFNQQTQANYIENFFNTYLYDGTSALQAINTGIPLSSSTASWTANKIFQGSSALNGVVLDSSGNIVVTGEANDGTRGYLLVAKYNSSKVLQWQRKAYEAATIASSGNGIVVDSSDNIYVIGVAYNASHGQYALILKYNSSGSLQWQRKLYENSSGGKKIAVDSSGNVYVNADANDGAVNYILTAKYNSSGTLQWQRKFYGPSTTVARFIAVDSSDNVISGGYSYDGTRNTIIIAQYNTSGTLQWQRKIYQNNTDCFAATTDSSGNIYLAGSANDGANDYALIMKLDSSGLTTWQRKFIDGYTIAKGIFVDSSNNVYVGGTSKSNKGYIIKCNSSGVLQWQRIFYQTNTSFCVGVTTNSSGDLFAVGMANDGSTNYGVLLALKSDGSTTSGAAFTSMFVSSGTDAGAGTTNSSGSATAATATATSATSAATEAEGTATSGLATQAATPSSGGLVWIKGRSGATDHALYDTSRGATLDIASNLTTGQTTQTTGLTAFSASGFAIGSLAKLNTSSAIYAAWTFREQAKFFDVVTYTGNGANRTISHNLGSVPGMILIKRTDTTAAWAVYHRSLANTEYLVLNTTAGTATGTTYWNSTTPTSTVFSLGTSTDVNANTGTYVAYLFAHDAGGFGLDGSQSVISCGSFISSGSGDNIVTLGWEPQYVLIKRSSTTDDWRIFDNIRSLNSVSADTGVGATASQLLCNTAGAETDGQYVGISATGFNAAFVSGSGTYIYLAIRRGPMKVPTDATTVFQPTVYTGTNVDNRLVNTTIAPDMVWARQRNSTTVAGMVVGDRLRGQPYMLTGATAAEVDDADSFDKQIVSTTEYGTAFSSMSGVWVGNDATSQLNASTTASNQIMEAFKRAPGFFDVACYTGTGASATVTHNLNAVPEMIIVKGKSGATDWPTYHTGLNGGVTPQQWYVSVNATDAQTNAVANWNNTAPTSTVFSVGGNNVASGYTYVAYLFASCPGVSKVGSYMGTGTTKQINCSFTSGARFVLIKRTDSTGDWYVYDTARGIVAGNDPYILLNSTAAEVTSTDYVDAYSAGFELSSTAPAGLNEAYGITWVARTSGFNSSTAITGVVYGSSLYVAVGLSGTLTTSPNGVTWTSRTSGFGANNINGVAYGNGIYVAVGDAGTLTTSTDGITWTSRTSGFGASAIYGVTYGNGLFVAVGQSGKLATSSDGITWTSQTSGFSTTSIFGVTYGNGLFVAVGGTGKMTTSTDGSTWTSRTSGFGTTAIRGVTYGNSLYVAVGDSGTLTTSTDGTTWTSRTSGFSTNSIYGIAYGNGVYVAGGQSGTMTTSTDGITWTSRTSGFSTNNINGVTYGNGLFVAVGSAGTMTTNNPTYIYLAIA